MDAKEAVYNALKDAGKAMKGKEIAELTGLDAKEVTKAITALKKEDRIESPKNCFYAAK